MESNNDSVSSGERTRMSLNRTGVIARWRCQFGVVGRGKGRIGPLQSYKSAG